MKLKFSPVSTSSAKDVHQATKDKYKQQVQCY